MYAFEILSRPILNWNFHPYLPFVILLSPNRVKKRSKNKKKNKKIELPTIPPFLYYTILLDISKYTRLLSLSHRGRQRNEEKKRKKVHKISIEAKAKRRSKEGNESEANKIDWTRSESVREREAWCVAGMGKGQQIHWLQALATGALLLLHHPHCSIKFLHRGTDTWATVVSRGPPMPDRFFLVSSWTANISLPFWPIKRDISSPPISLNAIRRQTSSTAICVELTNCRHALRCILGGQDHTTVSLRCWTLHRRRLK